MSNKVIIYLKNSKLGKIKKCPIGFSWTMLFFGIFLPYYREDWITAFLFTPIWFITAGLASIPFAFIYNKYYIKTLFKRNYNLYYFKGELEENILKELKSYQTA